MGEEGNIYSKRHLLSQDLDKFIKTSLDKVKEANIEAFKKLLCEKAKLEEGPIKRCLVYGELICNFFYDYKKRNLMADWMVFGSILEVKKELQSTLKGLLESGFAAKKKSDDQIQIFMNEKLEEVAKAANLNVPEAKCKEPTVAQVVEKHKDAMKKGEIEGVVITIHGDEFGFKIVKWKGAHELQPASEDKVLQTCALIKESEVAEDLRTMFRTLKEIIKDTSENKHMNKKAKKSKNTNSESDQTKTVAFQKSKYISDAMKATIQDVVEKSQRKLDSIEVHEQQGSLSQYSEDLVEEVKRHFMEEKQWLDDKEELSENPVKFIQHKVKATIAQQTKKVDSDTGCHKKTGKN